MDSELSFFLKLLRNGAILAGLLFVSIFATNELSLQLCKTVGVFFLGYVLTELAIRYKLKIPDNKQGSKKTLFF